MKLPTPAVNDRMHSRALEVENTDNRQVIYPEAVVHKHLLHISTTSSPVSGRKVFMC